MHDVSKTPIKADSLLSPLRMGMARARRQTATAGHRVISGSIAAGAREFLSLLPVLRENVRMRVIYLRRFDACVAFGAADAGVSFFTRNVSSVR